VPQRRDEVAVHVALVSTNGSSLVVRYVEGRNSRERAILADHMEGETFAPPTNVMVTDARGVSQWQRFDERWQAPGDDEAPLH
jgi:hypothetical protein